MKKIFLITIFFLFLFLIKTDTSFASTYYISNTGLDTNNGTSESTPWQTISKVNSSTFVPGDSILFKKGDSWFGQLIPKSGDSTAQVTYSSYGTGDKPILHQSVNLNNTSDWTEEIPNIWKTVSHYGSEKNTNISFDTDLTGWSAYFNSSSGASGTLSRSTTEYHSSPGSLQLDVTNDEGIGYDIQLGMTPTNFEADKTYELTFYAKATSPFLIPAIISSSPTYPFSTIVNPTQITTSWQKYTVYIPVTKTTTGNFLFALGGFVLGGGISDNTSFYLDDVSLKEIPKFLSNDVGNVIFNNEQSVGVKKWNKTDLSAQGQYWYDVTNHLLYMYSIGNPASYYTDIKAALNKDIIFTNLKSYITIDNLAIKYGAGGGFNGFRSDHLNITNNDVSWIGGAAFGSAPGRFGNGIGFYYNAQDILIENNKIWEIFDAALSNQYQPTDGSIIQSNITYRNNTIWNSEYCFEYFNRSTAGETSNIHFENNDCRNAGSGWGHNQRQDPSGYHLRLAGTPTNTTNFIIKNNIFSEATSAVHYNYDVSGKYNIDYNTITQSSGNIAFIVRTMTPYITLAAYQSATGWDTHSTLNSQPLTPEPEITTPPAPVTPPVTPSGGGGGGSSYTSPTSSVPPVSQSSVLSDKAKQKDIKQDGHINIIDFNIIMANWNKDYKSSSKDFSLTKGDMTGDGKIDIFDINQLMVYWDVKYTI